MYFCVSNAQYAVDPATGQEIKKKRLGGAYPGQRRPQHKPFMPATSQFGPDGKAVVHFKAYGGGNALTLVQQDGSSQPATGQPEPQFIQGMLNCSKTSINCFLKIVPKSDMYSELDYSPTLGDLCLLITVTLPDGVEAGQTIHVQAPDGKVNAIVIPPGFGPGSTFTVEFAPDEIPPSKIPNEKPSEFAATSAQPTTSGFPPPNNHHVDDGFATGFNNPNWTPPTAPVSATAVNNEPEVVVSAEQGSYTGSYPTTSAKPVYSTTTY